MELNKHVLIRYDLSVSGVEYRLYVNTANDYVIVRESISDGVHVRAYYIGFKNVESDWSNRYSLTYTNDVRGRNLNNEGFYWNGTPSFVGLLDKYEGAAVAFSLRRLSVNYSGDAVIVRRDSDNSTTSIGFKDDVLDQTSLTDFCNTPVNVYTSDFSVSENLFEVNGIGSANETVGGVTDAYKFTVTGGANQHFTGLNKFFSTGANITVTFDYYIPSTNAKVNSIGLYSGLPAFSFIDLDNWSSVSITTDLNQDNFFIFAREVGSPVNSLDADGDVFYLKNIVVTQNTSNGYVTTWYDQSGNGNDAVQNTASSQPKIFDGINGVVTENNKPTFEFDGVNDKLITSQNITNGTNPASFFWAGNMFELESPIFGKEGGTNTGLGLSQEGGKYRVYREFYGSNDHFTAPILNQQILLNFVMINGISDFYENGVQIPLPNPQLEGFDFYGDTRAIGSNFQLRFFDGKMQEFILYHIDQTNNRAAIENDINNHYNIY